MVRTTILRIGFGYLPAKIEKVKVHFQSSQRRHTFDALVAPPLSRSIAIGFTSVSYATNTPTMDLAYDSTAKRKEMITFAKKFFHQNGFHKTTLDKVAKLAGVPLGNVHYYCPGKQSLAEAVISLPQCRLAGCISRKEGFGLWRLDSSTTTGFDVFRPDRGRHPIEPGCLLVPPVFHRHVNNTLHAYPGLPKEKVWLPLQNVNFL